MLDFLLDNWYLTVFLLWFLFSLFGRSSDEKGRRQTKPTPATVKRDVELERQQEILRRQAKQKEMRPRQPEVAKKAMPPQEEADIFRPPFKREAPQDTAQPVATARPIIQEQLLVEDIPEIDFPKKQKLRERDLPLMGEKGKEATVAKIDRSALRQAIVWSEVLGPPRAQKPYRPLYLRRD